MSEQPKTEIDYRVLLAAFAKTTAEAAVAATKMWAWPARMHEPHAPAQLTDRLKSIFAHNIKRLFAGWKPYPRLEDEMGQIYGALVCHLQALHLRWNTFAPAGKAGHRFIRMNDLSAACTTEALLQARQHADLAAERIAHLLHEEAQLRSRAELFCALLQAHCDREKVAGAERAGHPIRGFYIGDVVFTNFATIVGIHYAWYDGVDLCAAGLGTLIGSAIGTADADKLLEQAFGRVCWSEDKNSIKFVADVPRG